MTTGGAKNEQELQQQCRGVTRAAQGNKDPTHTNVLSNHMPLSTRAARNRYTGNLFIMPTNVCPLALRCFHTHAVIPTVLGFHENPCFYIILAQFFHSLATLQHVWIRLVCKYSIKTSGADNRAATGHFHDGL